MALKNDKIAIIHEDKTTHFVEVYIDPEVDGTNAFKAQQPEQKPLPEFASNWPSLPQLDWPANPLAVSGYRRTWEIAFANLRQPTAQNGFVNNYIDTAFNNHLFMWDSAFITMFGKYAHHSFEFIGTLDNLYCKQMPDGFIGRELSIETGENHLHRHDPGSTGPNILPWAEWLHYEQTGDKQRLSKVFAPLLGLHRWIALNRTWKDGTYWGCGWSCGMDNQLRVEHDKLDYSHHSHASWIDVTLHQYLSASYLIKMHQELASKEDVSDLENELVNLKQVVNAKMWDPEQQFYFDTWRDDSLSDIKSIGAYWALLTDIVPEENIGSFIAHLDDEKTFKRPHRIPTMSADCRHYKDEGEYWRGGVWAPTNYMVLKGLEKHGYHKLAFDIAKNHVQHVADIYGKTDTLWENYAPELPVQGNPAKSEFVGWTGLSLVSILIEFVFGIKMDVPNKRIDIHPYLAEGYSLKGLHFGSLGTVDIEVLPENGLLNPAERVKVTTGLDLYINIPSR
ncbi:MGH1-like glycoside hydrolase domain-containing protein [Photobacterium gaetbulicola]|uniref:MGH1-like glycoside hydrolase domain-containing protein n=1 Tax=Photobacterium gaetbulicola TaxID=1295392 RepID=UPI00068C298B|nr:trehalase family glycosidase [Photobacterium gaetbulicola]